MSKRYAGLVFDCDGTLADTMPAHYVAWRSTMLKYGIMFEEERFYRLGGVPTAKIVAMLAEEAGVVLNASAVAREKDEHFHRVAETIAPIEPVVAIARAHRGLIPMGVATGSVRWTAERSLQHIGILDWFAALVSAEDVTHHKPAPDVYLEAARRLNVDPADCRAYEDTDIGLEAARAAGMDVVDVRPLYQR